MERLTAFLIFGLTVWFGQLATTEALNSSTTTTTTAFPTTTTTTTAFPTTTTTTTAFPTTTTTTTTAVPTPPPPPPPPQTIPLISDDCDLICNSTYMVLKLNKTTLEARNPVFQISFQSESSDSNCILFSNNATTQDGSFIWIESKLTGCGIMQNEDEDNIIFNQTIIIQYGNNPSGGLIYREEFDSYEVSCKIGRNETAEVSIGTVTETSLTFKKTDDAEFNIGFIRTDSTYENRDDSITAKFGDKIYLKLFFNESMHNDSIKMIAQQCFAYPENDKSKQLMILDKRCSVEKTTQVAVRSSDKFQFEIMAFQFFGNKNKAIKFECSVYFCEKNDASPTCANKCLNRRKRRAVSLLADEKTPVVRAEAKATSPLIIVLGQDETTSDNQSSATNGNIFGGTKGTIILVLIVVLILICIAVAVKKLMQQSPRNQPQNIKMQPQVETGFENPAMDKY